MSIQTSTFRGGIARLGVMGISVLTILIVSVAAHSMGRELTIGHVLRTLVHLIGIVGGLAIIYFANQIRRETSGSEMATISKYVIVGTVLFVLVFMGMEATHLFGVDLWYFADGADLTRTWYMISLAVMIFMYTLGFRKLVKAVGA